MTPSNPSAIPVTDVVIRSHSGWLTLNLREIFAYRDLLFLLVWRDFVTKYKQTVLGPLWFVIQPLLTTLVFTVIFGRLAGIPTDGLPPVLFYLCGLLGWNYFAQTFSTISTTFTANAPLFSKVYFPRLIIPIAATISHALSFILNLIFFFGFWTYFHINGAQLSNPSWTAILLVPGVLVHAALISLACGLWMAALTAKYRDLAHLSAFLVQLWLYATPVIYPLSQVSETWRWLAALNPMTTVVESCRTVLLGRGALTPEMVILSIAMTLILLTSALILFTRTEKNFIDTV